ncbi:hypothetical protein SNOG_12663 [Parastagonospora nodorum SN15]|uniref:Uncharacterized protein n=1 Tax=Phaeosphaeria nodorum (strain SN15 / ATCC MYA-4574 / FGSC 10173) TaxID=321614 RepID=Q0U6F1_PHANO|nr:hypothetical protein SNOG_12663 [Parastagonospora nodorum SN15]EAT79961.2 hypothetical protein SNOG_12663 [Parastagonospora nodorum SN15]
MVVVTTVIILMLVMVEAEEVTVEEVVEVDLILLGLYIGPLLARIRDLSSNDSSRSLMDTDYGLPVSMHRPFVTLDEQYDEPLSFRRRLKQVTELTAENSKVHFHEHDKAFDFVYYKPFDTRGFGLMGVNRETRQEMVGLMFHDNITVVFRYPLSNRGIFYPGSGTINARVPPPDAYPWNEMETPEEMTFKLASSLDDIAQHCTLLMSLVISVPISPCKELPGVSSEALDAVVKVLANISLQRQFLEVVAVMDLGAILKIVEEDGTLNLQKSLSVDTYENVKLDLQPYEHTGRGIVISEWAAAVFQEFLLYEYGQPTRFVNKDEYEHMRLKSACLCPR